MNTVKEAVFLQYGSTQPLTSMPIEQQTQLWESIMEQNVRRFSEVAAAIRPSDVKHVPLRILVPGRPAAVQAPITPTDQSGAGTCIYAGISRLSASAQAQFETCDCTLCWPQVSLGRSGRCWVCCYLAPRSAKRTSMVLASPGRPHVARRAKRSLMLMTELVLVRSLRSCRACGQHCGRRCKDFGNCCTTRTSSSTCVSSQFYEICASVCVACGDSRRSFSIKHSHSMSLQHIHSCRYFHTFL